MTSQDHLRITFIAAGAWGTAYTFFTEGEVALLSHLFVSRNVLVPKGEIGKIGKEDIQNFLVSKEVKLNWLIPITKII